MDQYLAIKEVVRRTGLSRSTIYEQMRKQEFPQSYQLTPRRVAWKASEVEAWIESRTTAADRFGAHRGWQVGRRAAGGTQGET